MKKKLHRILFCFACLAGNVLFAQQGLTKGAQAPDIAITKTLNEGNHLTSLNSLHDKLTIVDFFGTWCVPCLKALPHLTAIKQNFANEINIVLVSNETEAQLSKFIAARPSFFFPIIVDANNAWNAAFQPPALPYTAVLNKEGKVIAITDAASITDAAVKEWLAQKEEKGTTAILQQPSKTTNVMPMQKSSNAVIQLSQDYIYTAKTGQSLEALSNQLKGLSYDELLKALPTDNDKKAFWINIYNGYTQAALKAAPEKYKDRGAFFKARAITIAGRILSLDEIEHGFLRHSKIKWSLGHFNKLFPSKKEKQLRVDTLDYRVHFALNCGAKSCPPIAFYNPAMLDAQLDVATKSYLSGEAEFDSAANVIKVPKLMSWFRTDFGGKKGMLRILKKNGLLSADAKPKIEFKDYDWTLALNNYSAERK